MHWQIQHPFRTSLRTIWKHIVEFKIHAQGSDWVNMIAIDTMHCAMKSSLPHFSAVQDFKQERDRKNNPRKLYHFVNNKKLCFTLRSTRIYLILNWYKLIKTFLCIIGRQTTYICSWMFRPSFFWHRCISDNQVFWKLCLAVCHAWQICLIKASDTIFRTIITFILGFVMIFSTFRWLKSVMV